MADPEIKATLISEDMAARLRQITTAGGYPLNLVGVELGKFYEDLPDEAPPPLATLVCASSGPVAGEDAPTSAQRERVYSVEVVLDVDDHPGVERHVLLDQVEYCVCRALNSTRNGRALDGKAISLQVGAFEFQYPAPGHTIAVVTGQVNVRYIESFR